MWILNIFWKIKWILKINKGKIYYILFITINKYKSNSHIFYNFTYKDFFSGSELFLNVELNEFKGLDPTLTCLFGKIDLVVLIINYLSALIVGDIAFLVGLL